MSVTQDEVNRFKDRHAIYDCLVRFARGLDRHETDLLNSAFHDDATIDHGIYAGAASQFADFMNTYDGSTGLVQATNRVNQALIEFTGPDTADVETYVLSFLDTQVDGELIARTIGARYLDRFERRDGAWKIAQPLCTSSTGTATFGPPSTWTGPTSAISLSDGQTARTIPTTTSRRCPRSGLLAVGKLDALALVGESQIDPAALLAAGLRDGSH